ncbi:hypothetical protein BGW80DRAFT_1304316, partial [Lactifluus volemus]
MATLLISRAPSLLALLLMNRHSPAKRTQHYLPRADIDVHDGIVVRKSSKSPIQSIVQGVTRTADPTRVYLTDLW